MSNTIGLFGTCDNIRWRDSFMKTFEENGINYFNPMVDNWDPSLAEIEAKHLEEDSIILFPVLKESYGQGSLAEIAFGPLKDLVNGKNRSYILFIDTDVTDELKAKEPNRAKDSKRARALVLAHLKNLNMKNVHLVSSLEEMLELSVKLYKSL